MDAFIGEHRGHLTALSFTGRRDERGQAIYLWRCDCGAIVERVIFLKNLTSRMCPDGQKTVKVSQANMIRDSRKVDVRAGLTHAALENIIIYLGDFDTIAEAREAREAFVAQRYGTEVVGGE